VGKADPIRYDRLFPMKSDAIAFGVAGIAFGLIAGWIIGTEQAASKPSGAPPAPVQAAAPAAPAAPPPPLLDEAKVTAFKNVAEREPSNPKPRVELANLYFDSERYEDAIKWYADALKLNPNDVNVSTDLGISYYYVNQPDKAIEQFTQSLKVDPKHAKTLLNLGVVRAFGKQDLAGAEEAWGQLVQLAPGSPEAEAAKRALDSLRSAHPGGAPAGKPGA
jgi:tetratricopeptide (TPR) repeat protein